MFHVELRQAPHHLHRFNLSENELQSTLLAPWVAGAPIEMGERVWDPSTGSILVLEGPEIPIGRLTMGRGWAVAVREGADVTAQAIAGARQALAEAAAAQATAAAGSSGATGSAGATAPAGIALATQIPPADAAVLADALGLELLRGLGQTPMSLPAAWRVAAERHPQLPIGATLDLARGAVASLLRARLAQLVTAGAEEAESVDGEGLESKLASIDAWSLDAGPASLWIRRA
jgi:hypothetical protein